jgi:Ca2+-binding RTX toxin-like protein
MPDSIIFEVVGDQDWFDGVGLTGGSGDDTLELYYNQLSAVGSTPIIYLYGLGYIDMNGRGGNDFLQVTGVHQWQQIDLDGGYGDDTYSIWGMTAHVYVADSGGRDELEFSWVSWPVTIDLLASNGEFQYTGVNIMRLWGDIEVLTGSYNADRLYGNNLSNWINGQGGDDVIYGRDGDDILIGDWGNDLIYGNGGNDQIWAAHGDDVALGGTGDDALYGGDGRDLLIGGYGYDYVMGEAGDDILIGGATAFDGNEAALLAILAEWTSGRTRSQRQMNIQFGTGSATRLNQSYFLRTGAGGTLFDDAAFDALVTGLDNAWSFPQGNDQIRNP